MKTRLFGTVALTALLLMGCAADPGSPEARFKAAQEAKMAARGDMQEQVREMPDWFTAPPLSDHAVFSVGSGRSPSLDMALTKATLSAKRQLADRIAGELTEKIREFATEMGTTDDPVVIEELERATANIVRKVAVHGYRVSKKEVQVVGASFQAYILLEYGDEDINKVLKRKLQQERNATRDKRKKELFESLEKELEKEV